MGLKSEHMGCPKKLLEGEHYGSACLDPFHEWEGVRGCADGGGLGPATCQSHPLKKHARTVPFRAILPLSRLDSMSSSGHLRARSETTAISLVGFAPCLLWQLGRAWRMVSGNTQCQTISQGQGGLGAAFAVCLGVTRPLLQIIRH